MQNFLFRFAQSLSKFALLASCFAQFSSKFANNIVKVCSFLNEFVSFLQLTCTKSSSNHPFPSGITTHYSHFLIPIEAPCLYGMGFLFLFSFILFSLHEGQTKTIFREIVTQTKSISFAPKPSKPTHNTINMSNSPPHPPGQSIDSKKYCRFGEFFI